MASPLPSPRPPARRKEEAATQQGADSPGVGGPTRSRGSRGHARLPQNRKGGGGGRLLLSPPPPVPPATGPVGRGRSRGCFGETALLRDGGAPSVASEQSLGNQGLEGRRGEERSWRQEGPPHGRRATLASWRNPRARGGRVFRIALSRLPPPMWQLGKRPARGTARSTPSRASGAAATVPHQRLQPSRGLSRGEQSRRSDPPPANTGGEDSPSRPEPPGWTKRVGGLTWVLPGPCGKGGGRAYSRVGDC